MATGTVEIFAETGEEEATEQHEHAESVTLPGSRPANEAKPAVASYFVRYGFYKLDPAFRRLPKAERDAAIHEFYDALQNYGRKKDKELIRYYSTTGVRGDVDFLIWHITPVGPERFQAMNADILATGLGAYLTTPISYLAMTRRSIYIDSHVHDTGGTRLKINPTGAKYLFIYPFVKTRQWYLKSQAERQTMMDEHIRIGHKYPTVRLNTTYSFGLDDQEFVVAFETDVAKDFLDLVMELRGTEGSLFTLRDTPIYTCVSASPEQIIHNLGLGMVADE